MDARSTQQRRRYTKDNLLFAPGAPREAYFEGRAQLADLSDEEHSEWFIKNDNFFVE